MSELNAAEAPRRFWARPEQYLLDAGKDGELLIAKIRVALTFVLLLYGILVGPVVLLNDRLSFDTYFL